MKNCINYRYPLEHAESTEELASIVQHLLQQYELEVLRLAHTDASWAELAAIADTECEDDPDRTLFVSLLEFAEARRQALLAATRAGD